ncbi:iron-sulfur cluster-binding protein [Desulfotomaculum arcticum]|uniref:Iron-sulfur cluster-binding protein n=1 Tax=Desulfotruncus arcticus DSM 17038 TaxID=1121424 RepID=A0A1I2P8J4_9FIRM|nr:LUD domain-containing protein [Desulfotruncus arcticus]SFG12404.1 iron-sulfur cluster-binding protein [Desulfotomaculum arcticum] [Desulfotruncus arcticus DSM 17038]
MSKKGILKNNVSDALANENLRGALGRFGDAYTGAREKAYAGKDFEELRRQIAAIKGAAAANMELLAQRFTQSARARGAKVYRARTAQEARNYIKQLADEKGVRKIVKSKSMASEEIHLNEFLNQQGIEAVETDLGEWILQLSGQKPSHMVMPAIHMTRGEVADVFSDEVKRRLSADIPELVRVAREQLRKKFLEAQMGISGANIAVAETGTIVIMTNEGNARLTTTLPPVHVAIVGLEKLVEKFTDVKPILEALPRSATGQKITSYVTMITGPTPAAYPDGTIQEKELHIVLLDNGRTEMQSDPVFKEALQCIRCASCLNVCPVFQLVGGHVYGHIYTGGIGTILTAFFNGFQNASDIQNLCLGCERCKRFCSGSIDIPRLIRELRRRVAAENGLSGMQKFALEKVLPNRKLFHSLIKTARTAQKPFQKGPMVRHLPMFLAGCTEGRSLPAIAAKPFRDRVDDLFNIPSQVDSKPEHPNGQHYKPAGHHTPAAGHPARVGFFAGCLTDFVYPQLGEAVYKVLKHLGLTMVFPPEQSCCGVPAVYMGSRDAAAKLARQNIVAFELDGMEQIITACPTCAHTLKQQYLELLDADPAWRERARAFAGKVRHFSAFVAAQSENGKLLKLKPSNLRVTYHDSCHMKGCLGISEEPRALLYAAGLQLAEMEGSDRCCGFGGSYSVKFPQISQCILDKKLAAIEASGAQMLALDCPGCLLQLSGGLDSRGKALPVKHTAEILAQNLST